MKRLISLLVIMLVLLAIAVQAAPLKETDVLTWNGSAWARLTKGQMYGATNRAYAQTATTGYGFNVSRDLASGSTNSPLVYFVQDNAGDDQSCLRIKQDGSGAIFDWYDGAVKVGEVLDGGSLVVYGSTSGSIALTPTAIGTGKATIVNQNVANSTITLPSATTTLPGLSLNNTWTGTGTWNGSVSGGISIAPIATGTATATIVNQNVGASTITLPSATTTLPGLTLANTWTGAQTLGSTVTGPGGGSATYHKYSRITVAAINAAGATGIELLPAVTGRQYQLVNAKIVAYGGAMTSTNAATLKIVSDPAGSPVELFVVPKANLVRGTTAGLGINQMMDPAANNSLLADNLSFAAQTANKAIYLITGTAVDYDWATATGVDVEIDYIVI